MENNLTFQWIVPQLISVIGALIIFAIGIIGWIVRNILTNIESRIKEYVKKLEDFIELSTTIGHNHDLRITVLEEHILDEPKKYGSR